MKKIKLFTVYCKGSHAKRLNLIEASTYALPQFIVYFLPFKSVVKVKMENVLHPRHRHFLLYSISIKLALHLGTVIFSLYIIL